MDIINNLIFLVNFIKLEIKIFEDMLCLIRHSNINLLTVKKEKIMNYIKAI